MGSGTAVHSKTKGTGDTMTIRKWGVRAAAAVVALALVTGACSSDKKEGSSGSTTTTIAAKPATGTPIKVGITIWNNPTISLNLRMPGIRAGIQYVNNHGGVNNHPIQLVYCEAADANAGEECSRKMVSEGVLATINDANYLADLKNLQILGAANITAVDPFINSPETLAQTNVFMIGLPTPLQYAGTVQYAKLMGYKSLANFAGQMSAAQNSVDAIETAAKYYGITVKGRVDVPLAAADYAPYVTAAADLKADYYPAIIAPFMTDLTLKAADSMGEPIKIGVSEGQFNSGQYKTFAKGLTGSLLVECVPPLGAAAEYPGIQTMLDAISAYYAETKDPLAAPDKLTSLSTRAWAGVMAFWKVASGLPESDLNAAGVLKGFNTAQNLDLGVIPSWTPSKFVGAPAPYQRISNPYAYLSTDKSGVAVLYQKDPVNVLQPWLK